MQLNEITIAEVSSEYDGNTGTPLKGPGLLTPVSVSFRSHMREKNNITNGA